MSRPVSARNRHRRDSGLDDPGRARKPAQPVRRGGSGAGRVHARGCDAAPAGAARRRTCPSGSRTQEELVAGPGQVRAAAKPPRASRGSRASRVADLQVQSTARANTTASCKQDRRPRRARHSGRVAAGVDSRRSSGPRPCTGPARAARASSVRFAGSWRCWATRWFRSRSPACKSGNVTRGHRHSGRGVDSSDHRQLRSEAARELRDPLGRTSGARRSRTKSRRWARKPDAASARNAGLHHRVSRRRSRATSIRHFWNCPRKC